MQIAVVGGAGAMGRITVRDLVEFSSPETKILIADYNELAARNLARSLKRPNVRAVGLNLFDAEAATRALDGTQVLIQCTQYNLNLKAMDLALRLKAHYLDLGGLFHMTKEQLKLNRAFKEAGLTAILGMGAAPGITNLLSRRGAEAMDTVKEIHMSVGSADLTRYDWLPTLPVSYSLQTILEEFSLRPAVYQKGKIKFLEPMSGGTPHRFPSPVGVRKPLYTLHSELATIPQSFKKKGVTEVSFKIAFDDDFVNKVRFLRDIGLANREAIDVGGTRVKPIEVVNKIAMSQPAPKYSGTLEQYEVVRSVVKGSRGKKKVTRVLDCHTRGMPEWGMGTDTNTGCPPSIVAGLLLSGEISKRGTLAPERAVPDQSFFKALEKRNMVVREKEVPGWEFPA